MWFFVVMLLPESHTTPELAETIMADVPTTCEELGVTLGGGHTEITQGKTQDLSQALNLLVGLSQVVVVKRGPGSAICRSGDEQWSLAPPNVTKVDDIGAGDTFNAGFIHSYIAGAKLEDCLAFANIPAAYSVTKEGGSEAFRNRSGLINFIRQQWSSMGRGALPVEG